MASKIRLFPRRESGSQSVSGIKLIASGMVLLLMLEASLAAGAQQSVKPGSSSQPPAVQDSANAPETLVAQNAHEDSSSSLPSAPTPQPQQQEPAQQQPPPQQPVGTAAAPYEKPTGVPGSRPAGAVIAPAKQRRVRAIVIRVAVVAAAAAAVGTVVGLSKATHSSPQ